MQVRIRFSCEKSDFILYLSQNFYILHPGRVLQVILFGFFCSSKIILYNYIGIENTLRPR
jgi:hypothetical protein